MRLEFAALKDWNPTVNMVIKNLTAAEKIKTDMPKSILKA